MKNETPERFAIVTIPAEAARLVAIIDRLDCFTEQDLQQLTDSKQETLSAWRKRGEGPAYIRAGNRFLYPRAAVVEWLASRVRERKAVEAKGLL